MKDTNSERITNSNTSYLPKLLKSKILSRPGLVLMALAQGAGELIWWPYLIAKYGLKLLWLLPLASAAQYPINYSLAYMTATSGKGFFRLLAEKSRFIGIFMWTLFSLSFFWFGAYATSSGTAGTDFIRQFGLGARVSDRTLSLIIATIIVLVSLVLLTLWRLVYKNVQIILSIISITIFIVLLSSFFSAAVRHKLPEILIGLVPFGKGGFFPSNWQPLDWPLLISAVLFTGLGGFWNILYSYMVKAEGLGRCSMDINEFRFDTKFDDPPRADTYDWLKRLRKQLHKDVSIGVIGNFITTLLICLLTYTYLGGSGEIPAGWRLVVVQKAIFSFIPIAGPFLFLVVAFFFLADTWLATADQVSRIQTDAIVNLFGHKKENQRLIYIRVLFILGGITFTTMFMAQPRTLLLINGIINAFAMVLVIGCIYYIAWFNLEKWWRPRKPLAFALGLSSIFYVVGFLLYMVMGQ